MNDFQLFSKKLALSSRRRLECEWCVDGSQSETEMFIHRSVIHQNKINNLMKKPNVCLMEDSNAAHPCLKVIKDDEEMLRHYKRDHFLSSEDGSRIDREIFVCDLCNQLFFNKNLLAIHLVVKHSYFKRNRKFHCPKCNKRIQQNALWNHFEHHNIHSVTTCPICLTRAADRQELRHHLLSHPRYYRCGMCMYFTNRADSFYQHVEKYKISEESTSVSSKILDDDALSRYFVPKQNIAVKKYKNNMWYRGLVVKGVKVCILCREICNDTGSMRRHIVEHDVKQAEVKKSHVCSCGEEFSNKILLKQHCFRLKGDHISVFVE